MGITLTSQAVQFYDRDSIPMNNFYEQYSGLENLIIKVLISTKLPWYR